MMTLLLILLGIIVLAIIATFVVGITGGIAIIVFGDAIVAFYVICKLIGGGFKKLFKRSEK